MRTINVKGMGKFAKAPDAITIGLSLASDNVVYEKVIIKADTDLSAIRKALAEMGFAQKDIKTDNFNVSQITENVREENGNYKNVVTGYRCSHGLNIVFDYDTARLGKIINAISKSGVSAGFSINFIIKDNEAAKEQLLKSATQDGRKKAEVLAAAAGVKIDQIENITYDFNSARFTSRTNFAPAPRMMAMAEMDMNIQPEDVTETDYVNLTFSIK